METNSTVPNVDDESAKNDGESSQTDDGNTKKDDASTGTDDVVYAPDGGWGWMVTLAGFMVAFIEDGIVTSFGLLLPELLDTFNAGVSVTSLPPGILVATFLLSGPVTAYLVKRWGCRLVGFCGGLVAAVGVAGSAYAPNIYLFILCFGVVAGVGVGLIYLPSVTMVNMYFHKKRGIVTGIITSGSGFGLLALAPLTEMLMEQYGWRGCYLIVAAITLHFCVCASLMRPLTHPPSSLAHTANSLNSAESKGEDEQCPINEQEAEDTGECDQPARISQGNGDVQILNATHKKTFLGENGHTSRLSHHVGREEDLLFAQKTPPHGSPPLSSAKNLFLSHHVIAGSHVPLSSDCPAGLKHRPLIRSRSHGHLGFSSSHKPHTRFPGNVPSMCLASQVPPSLSHLYLHSHQSSDNMSGQHRGRDTQEGSRSHLTDPLRKRHHYHHHHHHRHYHHSDSRIEFGHSLPSVHVADEFVKQVPWKNHWKTSGTSLLHSTVSVEETHHAKEIRCAVTEPHDSSDEEELALTTSVDCRAGARTWVSSRLVFILFLLGAFLIQLICYVPPLLAPSYAYQYDISKEQVATVLSLYGLLNTAGRLLAGVLVYWGVRTLHVYNLGTLLSAVACFIFPSCTSFPSLAACLGLHGFFLGAFPPLQSVLLVEYLGLERLASTFGIMCLVKAFAVMAGPPLAGELFIVTGTYTAPLVVCGAVLVLAAICHQLMDCRSCPLT